MSLALTVTIIGARGLVGPVAFVGAASLVVAATLFGAAVYADVDPHGSCEVSCGRGHFWSH